MVSWKGQYLPGVNLRGMKRRNYDATLLRLQLQKAGKVERGGLGL
jgi:hypothetical protein